MPRRACLLESAMAMPVLLTSAGWDAGCGHVAWLLRWAGAEDDSRRGQRGLPGDRARGGGWASSLVADPVAHGGRLSGARPDHRRRVDRGGRRRAAWCVNAVRPG